MHRLIMRFEHTMRNAVLLVYLSALFIATSAYFAGHALGWGADLLFYVALAEAAAVEVHSFLSQRMTRELHQQLHADTVRALRYDVRDALERRFRLHLRITCGLVAFSMFNSVAFWATIMQPQTAADWAQTALRGAVLPLAFLAAGFLTAVREDVSDALTDAGDDLTRTMVRAATRQWRKRVRRARRRGANLAEPVAILLEMQESGGMPSSVMVRMMDAAIRTAEDGTTAARTGMGMSAGTPMLRSATVAPSSMSLAMPAAITPAHASKHAEDGTPTRPPTGPGTPTKMGRASKRARPGAMRPAMLRSTAPAEQRVRELVARYPTISVRTIASRARVSESTASKWLAIIHSEQQQQQQYAQ